MPEINTKLDIYEPSLIFEKSHLSPPDRSPPFTAEFWFVNQNPSQRVYVVLHRSKDGSTNLEDELLSQCHTAFNVVTTTLNKLLSEHLRTQDILERHRYGYALRNGQLSPATILPPAISINAISSPPAIPRVALHDIKLLETREIRKNVRIAKFADRKCLYKSVRYEDEAVAMSFEICNYKCLMRKGLQEHIPELIALVYVMDEIVEPPISPVSPVSLRRMSFPPVFEEGELEELRNNEEVEEVFDDEQANPNIHYIGALFTYYPQRDLTTQYITAPLSNKLIWMQQIITAIAALENADFKHWDLKCENIVLDTSMIISRDASGRRLSNAHPTEGNPGQVKIIDLENTKASDMYQPKDLDVNMTYALGKTIVELFTGKVPARGAVPEGVLQILPEIAQRVVKACCVDRNMSVKEIVEAMETSWR